MLPMGSIKSVSSFGPAVLPAIGNTYTNVLFYCVEDMYRGLKITMRAVVSTKIMYCMQNI